MRVLWSCFRVAIVRSMVLRVRVDIYGVFGFDFDGILVGLMGCRRVFFLVFVCVFGSFRVGFLVVFVVCFCFLSKIIGWIFFVGFKVFRKLWVLDLFFGIRWFWFG